MVQTIELLPKNTAQADKPRKVFASEEDYVQFRESFMAEVAPEQEKWREARRKSEEEARARLLR